MQSFKRFHCRDVYLTCSYFPSPSFQGSQQFCALMASYATMFWLLLTGLNYTSPKKQYLTVNCTVLVGHKNLLEYRLVDQSWRLLLVYRHKLPITNILIFRGKGWYSCGSHSVCRGPRAGHHKYRLHLQADTRVPEEETRDAEFHPRRKI